MTALGYKRLFTFLNVIKYITFRTGLAFFTSLLIVLLIGEPFIKLFSKNILMIKRNEIIVMLLS